MHGFFYLSSADSGQSSAQSFVHVTSAPAMIGYTRKIFWYFVGITCRRRTNVFCPWTIVQNVKNFCSETMFLSKSLWFFYPQAMDFCLKTNVFGQKSIICARLNALI
jgi:hypothetical protein